MGEVSFALSPQAADYALVATSANALGCSCCDPCAGTRSSAGLGTPRGKGPYGRMTALTPMARGSRCPAAAQGCFTVRRMQRAPAWCSVFREPGFTGPAKGLPGHVFHLYLWCLNDNVLSEPDSWIVVGMIPVFDKKKAIMAGRPDDGPESCAQRKTSLLHQCYGTVLQGWDHLTSTVKRLQWADGRWHLTQFFLRAILADQPETDTCCCDTSQSCKLRTCPKNRLHLSLAGGNHSTGYQLKTASKVQAEVYRAAHGFYSNRALFFDWGSIWRAACGPYNWRPTAACQKAVQGRTQASLCRTHIVPNAFWNVSGFDLQQMVQCLDLHI
jgi:hypothetical protein